MILDIVIAAVILISLIDGFRRGFVFTFIHTSGWIIAAVLAFIGTGYTKEWIIKNTPLGGLVPEVPVSDSVPEIIHGTFISVTSGMLTSLLVFAVLFIAVKLVLNVLLYFFTKAQRGGFTGFFDGLFGMAFGLLKGIVASYIILLLILPLAESFLPDTVPAVDSMLESSKVASVLYDKNPIVFLLEQTF